MVLIEEETHTSWGGVSETSEILAEEQEVETETPAHVIQPSVIGLSNPKYEADNKLIIDKLNTLLDQQATILSRLDNLTEAVIEASGAASRGTPGVDFPICNVTNLTDFEALLSDATERLLFVSCMQLIFLYWHPLNLCALCSTSI